MTKLYSLLTLFFIPLALLAQYTTPGTGQTYSLDELVTLSNGTVTSAGNEYKILFPLFIAANDTFEITTNNTIRIAPQALITVEDSAVFNVYSNALFTKLNPDSNYVGFRFESLSKVDIEGPIFEYGGGFKSITGDLKIVDCIMRYNNGGSSTSAVVGLSNGSPLFSECTFFENETAAIGSPANGSIAPTIINCTFTGNNLGNSNRPQINLGPSGVDTIKIINNTITGYAENSKVGGIAVSNFFSGNAYALITGNTITNNRYGVTAVGTFYSLISGNIIEDNNTQGDPSLGGSGININSGGENSHVILDNEIRGNLWGITTQGNALINLGDLDDAEIGAGNNVFSGNGNGGEIFAFYNNTPNFVSAQANCWTEDNQEATEADIEAVIFHFADADSLGLVDYSNWLCGAIVNVPCDSPSDLVSDNITFDSAQISWTAPTIAPGNGYEYFYGTDNQEPTENGTQTDESSIILSDLTENTTYYFWVRSDCGEDYSDWAGPESFTTDIASGVSTMSLDQIATLYPNPTSGVLNIDISDNSAETIAIFDLSGRELELIELNQTQDIQLDLSNYAAGVYIIKISGNDFIANGKFIVQ